MHAHHAPQNASHPTRIKSPLSALTGGIGQRLLVALLAATSLWLTVVWALS